MSKNSIIPFLKDHLINFLTSPFLLDTNGLELLTKSNNIKKLLDIDNKRAKEIVLKYIIDIKTLKK